MHILEWIFESFKWYETHLKGDLDRENDFKFETMMVARASRHGNLSMVEVLN